LVAGINVHGVMAHQQVFFEVDGDIHGAQALADRARGASCSASAVPTASAPPITESTAL
jgi:hypothetical protein